MTPIRNISAELNTRLKGSGGTTLELNKAQRLHKLENSNKEEQLNNSIKCVRSNFRSVHYNRISVFRAKIELQLPLF